MKICLERLEVEWIRTVQVACQEPGGGAEIDYEILIDVNPTSATSDRHNLDACIVEGADLLVGRTGIGD